MSTGAEFRQCILQTHKSKQFWRCNGGLNPLTPLCVRECNKWYILNVPPAMYVTVWEWLGSRRPAKANHMLFSNSCYHCYNSSSFLLPAICNLKIFNSNNNNLNSVHCAVILGLLLLITDSVPKWLMTPRPMTTLVVSPPVRCHRPISRFIHLQKS